MAEVIIDSSAVVAILRAEPPAAALLATLAAATTRQLSAANLFEIYMVIDRAGSAPEALAELFTRYPVTIAPVTAAQVELTRVAFQRYGKGSGHATGLNCGDCFAYALAQDTGDALLFIGNDFAATDLPAAMPTA